MGLPIISYVSKSLDRMTGVVTFKVELNPVTLGVNYAPEPYSNLMRTPYKDYEMYLIKEKLGDQFRAELNKAFDDLMGKEEK